ncbi:TM2 domain-containing protein [uncultured Erythrobacter sp.]|uniref:TM2 domain-containing protein n=1 Tax=uncultured Erythrobacter sp. TaxID=263913 RepID=UPI0026036319|nr:TM2 domain-containing protein [uncultured Erythrobacter sp.]
MDESTHQQMLFEANRKSVAATYLLWFFVGVFGAHRFYAGSKKTGLIQLALLFSVIGWLVLIPWLLADLFLIPGMVRDRNMELIEEITYDPAREAEERLSNPKTLEDRKRAEMLEDLRRTGFSRNRLDVSRLER